MNMHSVLSRMMAAAGLITMAAMPMAAQAKGAGSDKMAIIEATPSLLTAVASERAATQGLDLVLDVSGINSVDGSNSPNNVYLSIQATPGALVDVVSWNVTLEALGESWLSEMAVRFGNSDGFAINLRPGIGVNTPGVQTFSGSASLVDAGLSFNLGADGLLLMQFFETFNDGPGTDGIWQSGTLTFDGIMPIPEPSTYGLMALGLLGVAAAARRRKAD